MMWSSHGRTFAKNWLEFDGVSFGEEDTVLTLSTCCRKYDEYNTGNQRLVLMAKLLPEGAIWPGIGCPDF